MESMISNTLSRNWTMIVYVAKLGFGWFLVSGGNLANQFLLPKSHDPGPFECMPSSQAFMETKHFPEQ